MAKSSGGADVLVKIGGDLSEFQNSLGSVLGEVQTWVMGLNPVLAGAVAAVAAIGTAAVNVGLQYEEASNKIRTATGATGAELQGLMGDFKAVFTSVPEDAATVAEAISGLNARLELTGKPLQDLTNQFLDLASVTGIDVAEAIQLGTRVFGDWGITADKQASTLDLIYKASEQTGASFDGLAAKVVQFGAPLRQMGFSLEESVALLGKFEKEGVNTELVMGSLRIALGKMAQDGVSDVKAGLNDVMEAIKAAGSAGEANAIAIDKFGARAGPDMAAAIREGRFEIDGLLESLRNSTETISTADAATETFTEKLSLLWHWVQSMIEPLGTLLVQAGRSAADAVIGLVNGSGALSESLKGVLEWFKPLTDVISTKVLPYVGNLLTAFVGLESFLAKVLIATLQFLWEKVLSPLATFIRDFVVGSIDKLFGALNQLMSVLQKIPGVSKLFEEGQKTLKLAVDGAKASMDKAADSAAKVEAAHKKAAPAAKDNAAAHTNLGKAVKDAADESYKSVTAQDAYRASLELVRAKIRDLEEAQKRGYDVSAQLLDLKRSEKTLYEGLHPEIVRYAEANRAAAASLDDLIAKLPDLEVTAGKAVEKINDGIDGVAKSFPKWKDAANQGVDGVVKATSDGAPKVKDAWDSNLKQVSTAFTDFSKGLVQDLFNGDLSIGGAFSKLGQSITRVFMEDAMSAVNHFIDKGLKLIISNLDDILGKIPGIGSALGGILGSGGSAAGGAVSAAGSAAGAAGSAAGSVGSAAGGASSAAGAAVSSVTAVVGAVGAVGSMVSGIIGNFQNARMETTLNHIEEGTRYSALYLGGRADGGILMQLFKILEELSWGTTNKAVLDMRDWLKSTAFERFNSIADSAYWSLRKLEDLNGYLPGKLDNLGNLKVDVQVKVFLDSDEISAKVEQKIEFKNRLATA